MARKTYIGGHTVVRAGGRWPNTSEADKSKAKRFGRDNIQSVPKRESRSGLEFVSRKAIDPSRYLGLVVWAISKGKLPPPLPFHLAKTLGEEIRQLGGPEAWARSQPRFKIIQVAIARKLSTKTEPDN